MKVTVSGITRLARAAALVVCASLAAFAQAAPQERGRLRLDALDSLRDMASEHVVVDVDASLIRFATAMLSEDDMEEREVKQMVADLKGVYVRSYEFNADGQYGEALASIRRQLGSAAWSRMVDLKSSDGEGGNLEVYLANEAGRVQGLALLAAGAKKMTIINIVGSVDLEKLRKLEGKLGIPKISIERKGDDKGSPKRP
jgi:hypothetical protein